MKNPAAVALGTLGGKAGTGKVKARTSEQARAAVQARWKKRRKTKRVSAKPNSEIRRRWWSGIWMTDELLMAVAKEEEWKPETACAARDAAAWLNANGKTVVAVAERLR